MVLAGAPLYTVLAGAPPYMVLAGAPPYMPSFYAFWEKNVKIIRYFSFLIFYML
jgi:hypothetical protein